MKGGAVCPRVISARHIEGGEEERQLPRTPALRGRPIQTTVAFLDAKVRETGSWDIPPATLARSDLHGVGSLGQWTGGASSQSPCANQWKQSPRLEEADGIQQLREVIDNIVRFHASFFLLPLVRSKKDRLHAECLRPKNVVAHVVAHEHDL